VNHRAFEPQLGDGALELVRRRLRVGGGKRRKTGEALGMGANGLVQAVVRALRERHRGRRIEALRRGRAVRDHLRVDSGFVHFLQAQRAQVVQPPAQLGVACLAGPEGLRDVGVPVMLFECDDKGSVLGCHGCDCSGGILSGPPL